MDPVTFLGLVASVIEIATFIRGQNRPVTAVAIDDEFTKRAQRPNSEEAKLRVTSAQVLDTAGEYLAFDDEFADRIAKCMTPYKKALSDGSNTDVDEAYQQARVCVCGNIKMARRHHSGGFPDDRFKKWFEQFNCVTL